MLIEKNGGCTHVRCTKCDFELCWMCMGKYERYKHSDPWKCAFAVFSTAIQTMFWFFGLVLIFDFLSFCKHCIPLLRWVWILTKVAFVVFGSLSLCLLCYFGIWSILVERMDFRLRMLKAALLILAVFTYLFLTTQL